MPGWSPWKFVVTCLSHERIISRGLWLGDNPLTFSTPVFMLQVAVCSFCTGFVDFLLRPFGLCSFFSNMMGAIAAGPLVLGSIPLVNQWIFSYQSLYVFETFQHIGSIFFFFLVGLKMDIKMAMSAGNRSLTIGFYNFFIPLIISIPVFIIIKICLPLDHRFSRMLFCVALNQIETSFHVVISLLSDLKLLNCELGRLAVYSSMISNTFTWCVVALLMGLRELAKSSSMINSVYRIGAIVFVVVVAVFIMRPIMLWMIRDMSEETNNIKEGHVNIVFLMVLITSFIGQIFGQPVIFGPMVLGLAVPPGPPLATILEDKLESLVTSILLPIYYIASAGRTEFLSVTSTGFALVSLFVIVAFLGKFTGTMVASIHCNVPLQDALTLALILSSQGIMDVQHFRRFLVADGINLEVYGIMTYWSVAIAGITSLMVKCMYQPSKRYTVYRRSLQHNQHDSEFRILACAYHDSNAPIIIDLLEASYPTMKNPICVYLLNLIEIQNMGATHLVTHKRNDTSSSHYNRSKHIINAFRYFEKNNPDVFSVFSFTAMSPLANMHDDICSLASDKRTTLIVLPFHRQLTQDGIYETSNGIRHVNRNVLKMAPCSIGILINRGCTVRSSCIMGARLMYRVGIFFLGGADDREVLIYGMRMGEQPNTAVTLTRFRYADETDSAPTAEHMLNVEVVTEFTEKFKGNERITYREEVVTDGIDIVRKIKSIEDNCGYDLMMVGRQHGKDSPLLQGLEDWNEFPELGFMGDLLATSTSQNQVSILVLQREFMFSQDTFRTSQQNLLQHRQDMT